MSSTNPTSGVATSAAAEATAEGLTMVLDDSSPIRNPDRWFFDKARLENTPSRRSGVDSDKELSYRQQAANFIQDIGQRLQVNQLCINTAIVYMHRFFMYHSFTHFHRNSISTASIFLAAKVEEQPRKLDHVIKVSHYCLHREQPVIDPKSDAYQEQSAELVMNENILLQTLGFDVAIDHPHTHVVKCCQLVRASKDLAQTSYFMATNSLHLTTMCLQYKPTVVACVCIHLACKWSSWEIPRSKEGKDWWMYVDDTVTAEQLEQLTTEFLVIFNKSPSRLKRKIISLNAATKDGSTTSILNVPGLAPDSLISTSGQSSSSANRSHSRSRSPSPKRPRVVKPGESHSGMMVPNKPHPGQMHHGMKPPPNHHGGQPPQSGTKQPHPTTARPLPPKYFQPGKDHFPHIDVVKEPSHRPHPPQQQQQSTASTRDAGKVLRDPGHGHLHTHGGGPYPHGSSRPNLPNAQLHHSHSSQGGGGHGLQGSKPPAATLGGSSSTASAHHPPYPNYVGASSATKSAPSKPLNTSQANPPHLSQTNSLHQSNSSHLNHPSAPNLNQNQIPALVSKNHNQIHQHAKKPYERTDLTKRDGVVSVVKEEPGSRHLQQPVPRSIDKPVGESIEMTLSGAAAIVTTTTSTESHKHKKEKKHKHKDKEKHKEKKEHKKDRHKEKGGKHKHKDRSSPPAASQQPLPPQTDPLGSQKLKIKLTINKGDKGGVQLGSSKKNSNLRQ